MNIIKAAKSGQPFRRKGWSDYLTQSMIMPLTQEDILADDWEIEDPDWIKELRKRRKGILCWVWDGNEENRTLKIIISYEKEHEGGMPFIDESDVRWKNAKPIKKEEIKDVIYQGE